MTQTAQLLPLRKGVNFAPIRPLQAVKDQNKEGQSHYLCDALKERYQHFMAQDKETWHDLITTGHLVSLFIQGKQNLRWNKLTKNFYAIPVQQEDNKTQITPIMGFYALNCEARYITSNPDVLVSSRSEDDESIQAAKAAKIIVDHYENKLYTNWFNLQEGLLLMSFGTNINRVRWDSGKEGLKALTDIFEDREFPISAGVGQCYDCGHTGTGEEYLSNGSHAECPNCESTNAYAEPPTNSILPMKTGEKPHNLGDIVIKTLEFPACRWDLRHKAEDSSHFIYEEMTNLGVIQQYLGNVTVSGDPTANESFGLGVIESIAKEGNAINGRTQNNNNGKPSQFSEKVKITEMSLSAADLAGMRVAQDEETLDGKRLPKGELYSKLFPNGLTAVGLNGFNVTLGVYAESHRDELTTGIWHMRPLSGAGRGHSDSVQIQKRRNETDSQGYLAMRHNATPATFYAKDAISESDIQYISKPDVGIPVDFTDFPEARGISDLIASPRIGQIDSSLLSFYISNLENMMQLTMGTTSFAGGLPGVNNKTATGARISDANSEAIFGPMLAIKVDVRVRAAELFVTLYRDNVPVKSFFPLEKKYGSENGKWLAGADVSADFNFSITKNSELSKNRWTIIEDNQRFMASVGGAQGFMAIKQADPEFADELMRRYGVDYDSNHQDETAQICRQRLQYAKKLIEQFTAIQEAVSALVPPDAMPQEPALDMTQTAQGTYELPKEDAPAPEPTPQQVGEQQLQQMAAPQQPQVDPMTAQAMAIVESIAPPITPYEPNHADKAKWFSFFLDTDEGRSLDPLLRQVVYKCIESHFMAGTQQQMAFAQMAGQVGVAQSAPGMVADVAKAKASNRDDQTGQR